MASGMCEDPVIFKPLRFDLAGPHTKSPVRVTLPHSCNPLESLRLIY